MSTILRTCDYCKEQIIINTMGIKGVAFLRNKFYHTSCLVELANQRISKAKHAEYWDYALEYTAECEAEAKKRISYRANQDGLNDWILEHYNVVKPPERIWSTIADLGNGKYHHRKCKPVDIETLFQAWKWGQKKLNEINQENKRKKTGPTDDNQRVIYDLSIIISHIPDYLSYKAKKEVAANEIKNTTVTHEVDISKIGQRSKKIKMILAIFLTIFILSR